MCGFTDTPQGTPEDTDVEVPHVAEGTDLDDIAQVTDKHGISWLVGRFPGSDVLFYRPSPVENQPDTLTQVTLTRVALVLALTGASEDPNKGFVSMDPEASPSIAEAYNVSR